MKKVFTFLMGAVFSVALCACVNNNAEEVAVDTVDTVVVEDTCEAADSAVECIVVEDTVVE